MSDGVTRMLEQADGSYKSNCGMTMKREQGKTPNGNSMNDDWVLRDADGAYIGHRSYQNDMEAPFKIKLVFR